MAVKEAGENYSHIGFKAFLTIHACVQRTYTGWDKD